MKKIFALLTLLLPLCLNAQWLGKHHVEIGAGAAIPGEVLVKTDAAPEASTFSVYGEYLYELTPDLSVGGVYSYVFPHIVTHPLEEGELHTKDDYHTLDVLAEYKLLNSKAICVFAGAGGGPQLRRVVIDDDISWSWTEDVFFSADLYAYVGIEFRKHIRLTVGHHHDLHYPISGLPSGAPYSHISLGWAF